MKSNLTKIISILTIILLTFLFFWKILLTNLILVGVDSFLYFYPYKAYATAVLRQGQLPLWNPYLFMGAPLLANSQVGVFYPFNWLFIWLDPPRQVAWSIGLHLVLAGVFMLVYTRLSLQLAWFSAWTAAVVFAFGGYLGAQVEHINQLNAAVWLPLLFLFYDFGLKHKSQQRWPWFLLLAFVIALTLLAGHAQTVFISLFGLGLYALWQGLSEGQRSAAKGQGFQVKFNTLRITFTQYLWPLIVAALLAAAVAAIQLIPTAELSAHSIRSGGLPFRETVSFSLSPVTLPYALLPPLGVDLAQVWDEAFGERVAYVGVSGFGLALIGAFGALRRPEIRRFVVVAAGGLGLSVGLYSGPLYLALYTLVPGFNLFRVPPRWLLLYIFGVSVLAGYGCNALFKPLLLREHLAVTWRWLRARRRRLAFFIVLPAGLVLVFGVWKTPPFATLVIWLSLALITFGLIYYILRPSSLSGFSQKKRPAPTPGPWLLLPLLIVELFCSAQTLSYNHPTAPQAYHSMRNSVAFLRSVAANATPPDRFLSLSGIAYDPGDARELAQIYGPSLSDKALYNLIVATKQKEVLFFNLPLVYGLYSVDGYDGGILPLANFVTLQKLFLPPDDLSLDGRLREKLRFVPPGQLLSLLNTRWIITDKVFDAWIDGIFYDLQFPAHLAPGQSIATTDIPAFPATAIGLVSHLAEAAHLPAGTPVAELTLTFADGAGGSADPDETFTLKAGVDTAEGIYPPHAAHPQANIGVAWPYEAAGVDYVTVYTLTNRRPITRIKLTGLLPQGQFILKGLSLIHEPTHTSRSIILSTQGEYRQVHSGDVKIYENQTVLPRAFIVHRAELVADTAQALALMRNRNFDLRQTLVRLAGEGETVGPIALGRPSTSESALITAYTPERVEVTANLASPGWLVLSEAYYPGWQVRVDGQPVEIMPVNIMFRAVELPVGEHVLVFEFKPASLQMGMWVSGLALLVLAGGWVMAVRKSRQER
ncbi:MAG: YfhO family protein [Anaerolineae bacterium]|nr:YfhO family protein [Anaerolineae bacterium]